MNLPLNESCHEYLDALHLIIEAYRANPDWNLFMTNMIEVIQALLECLSVVRC